MSFYIIQCICFLEFYINIMLMRKFLSFFFVMTFYVVGAYAQVLVQGQPHPSARNISTKQESQLRADASFTFDDISTFLASDCVSDNSRHNHSPFSAVRIFPFSPLSSVQRCRRGIFG